MGAENGTVPVGTKITAENWHQYQQVMSKGLQAFFSGQYAWKMPPETVIEVGPQVRVKLPSQFHKDTEEYSGQVKLEKLSDGGYLIRGYVAGVPFPTIDPSDPLAGYKVMYNTWYAYRPQLTHGQIIDCLIDRYGNKSGVWQEEKNYKLSHLSDPGYPTNYPGANGIFTVANLTLLGPEQSRYTTSLTIVPDDLTKYQENYVFLLSLRRSLRLSSAARCAPLLGSDYTPDDIGLFNPQVTKFAVDFLGEKPILALAHPDAKALVSSTTSCSAQNDWLQPPLNFPLPRLGKFELRDTYVIDLKPLPNYRYCYAERVLYVDKETGLPFWVELYDANNKLWKVGFDFGPTIRVPGSDGEQVTTQAATWSNMYDLQNIHASISAPTTAATYNSDTPGETQDVATHITPGGLAQVMK